MFSLATKGAKLSVRFIEVSITTEVEIIIQTIDSVVPSKLSVV